MAAPLGELLTAMVTPFHPDGSVNFASARRLAHHLVETGSDGIVVCGTTGEGPTVSDREKIDLLDALVEEVDGSACVVANTGTYDTHHSVALTRAAVEAGADAFLAVTPYYNKPPRSGIVAHFGAIAEAADGRPVIVYNIPQRVVLNLEPDVLAELAGIRNVVAVKQATADLDQARQILADTDLMLYAGQAGGHADSTRSSSWAGRVESAWPPTWPARRCGARSSSPTAATWRPRGRRMPPCTTCTRRSPSPPTRSP